IDSAEKAILTVSPDIAEFLADKLRVWRFYEKVKLADAFAPVARRAWDEGRFVDALDCYRRMADLHFEIIPLSKELSPAYERIALGNHVGMLTNAAQATVKILETQIGNPVDPHEAMRVVRTLYEAYRLGTISAAANPAWSQYGQNLKVCR